MRLDRQELVRNRGILDDGAAEASDESVGLGSQQQQGFEELDGGEADEVDGGDSDQLELSDELVDGEADSESVLPK